MSAANSGAYAVFDNPARYEAAREGFKPAVILQVVVFHALLTGVGFALGWFFPSTVAPTGGQYGPVLVALVAQIPLVITTARLFVLRRREAFWQFHGAMTLSFCVWLGLLVWAAPTFYAVILATLFAIWAYHDAWTAAGERVGAVFLAAAPGMDLALLAVDAAGGRGLVWAWQRDHAQVLALLAVQAVLTVCVQWLIRWVGREVKEQDRRAGEQAQLEQELASMRREREVIQASCALLATGLVASKVSHDLASPVSVLRLGTDALRTVVDRLPQGPDRRSMAEVAEDLEEVARRVEGMTADFARAVREREPVGPVEPAALCAEAEAAMQAAVRGHQVAAPAVHVELAPGPVWVAPGHASTLANVLTNGALHAPGHPLEVRGERAGDWYYRLSVRDRGVEGPAREETRRRVEALLAMKGDAGERPPSSPRGYGVGLVLGRLYLVRYGGWLSVRAADEGAGLVFDLLLPAADPGAIPAPDARPELLAR